MNSIIQDKEECYLCRMLAEVSNTMYLEEHHVIFGTANRKLSEKYGLKVYLCADHHRNGPLAVHRNYASNTLLRMVGQEAFEKSHSRNEFIRIFGRNYL